jgi:hypothetical protein
MLKYNYNHYLINFIYLIYFFKKGNCFVHENFAITDLNWFLKVFSILSQSTMKSNDYLTDLIGENISIWQKDQFVIALKDYVKKEKLKSLIEHLNDINLFIEYENWMIPTFLLNNEPYEFFESYLNHEFEMTWTLFNMSSIAFYSLIKTLCDSKRTKKLWKNGILNHDGGCHVLVKKANDQSILKFI